MIETQQEEKSVGGEKSVPEEKSALEEKKQDEYQSSVLENKINEKTTNIENLSDLATTNQIQNPSI